MLETGLRVDPPSAAPLAERAGALACLDGVAVNVQRTPVLRGVDLHLGPAEVVGVLGGNGSGKTTLLHVLATLVTPSAGVGQVLGAALGGPQCASVRSRIALVGHQPALYPQLTLAENLRFVARLTGRNGDAADRALGDVGLGGAAQRRADRCSQGMQRRAELARVLLTEPLLLLLDEVHTGLDADAVGLVGEAIRRVRARGGACVLVSHEPDRLTGLVDRLVRVSDGRAFPAVCPAERAEPRS
jgi:heme exporter protein A